MNTAWTRSAGGDDDGAAPPPLFTLPTRQRAIVEAIDAFHSATGEACPADYLARRLQVHHTTIREHLTALHRKGWLRSPNAPAFLRRRLRPSEYP